MNQSNPPDGGRTGHGDGPFRIIVQNSSLARLVASFGAINVAEWGYVTALSVDAFRRGGTVGVSVVGLRLFLAALASMVSPSLLHNRRPGRVLIGVAAFRALFASGSAILALTGVSLSYLFIFLALDALVSAPYRPAQSAVLAGVSRSPRDLVASAASMSTVKTLSQAVGAVSGGLLLAVAAPQVVFAAVAVIFGAAAALVLPFRKGASVSARARHAAGLRGLLGETAAIMGSRDVGTILLVSGLRTFVRGMWAAIAVIASLRLLRAGSAGVGLLMLAGGVGSFLAAPLSGRIIARNRIGTPTAVSLALCGVPLAVIAGVPVLDAAMALIAAWGIGMAIADVATTSLLNRLLSTPALPRVTSAIEATKLALEGLGAFVAPLLAAVAGVRGALVVAAFPLPFVVAVRWRSLHQVDASAGERAALLELLHHVPCLEPLDMASLDLLIGRMTPMYLSEPDTEVVRQHDPGDHFYVIEFGRADVLVDGFVVGRLGPGDSFGERALLREVPRTATVRSLGPMQLLVLARTDFLEGLTGQDAGSLSWLESRATHGGAEWNERDRARVLSQLNLFSHLDTDAIHALARHGRVHRWPDGAAIIRQGEEGDRYYVLLEGRALVLVDGAPVNELRAGDQFGEIALLHDVPPKCGCNCDRAGSGTQPPPGRVSGRHPPAFPRGLSQRSATLSPNS